jgi:streptogramin lyase
MEMDSQDRLWIAEFNTANIAMLDTKTDTVTEYPTGVPWFDGYDAIADKNGEIWASGMTTDRVVRLDPKTGQSVAYLMPLDTNVRRVFVDSKKGRTSFWAGSNHGAAIVHVEPLD